MAVALRYHPLLRMVRYQNMDERETRPKTRLPRDPNKPRGQLEGVARRVGGHGYSLTPHALFRFSRQLDLGPFDLLVLLAILSHAGREFTDYCTASFDVLASDTGLHRNTVIKHVNRLRKDLKLLTSSNKPRTNKKLTPNTYEVQLLAKKLKALEADRPVGEPDAEDDLESILAELMTEPGAEVDADEPGGVEVPVSPPQKRKGRWATIEIDASGAEGRGESASRSGSRSATVSNRRPRPAESKSASRSRGTPSFSGHPPSRLVDDDRARLDRGKRLRHPEGHELSVDEHLQRMREMECYSKQQMVVLLMDLGFPDEFVTATINADPVERLARLSGAAPAAQGPTTSAGPYFEPVPESLRDDPFAREAYEALNAARKRKWERGRGQS